MRRYIVRQLVQLVVVILGISILAFFSRLANGLEDWLQRDLDVLRPGLGLIVLSP